jgi:hypothetical protein
VCGRYFVTDGPLVFAGFDWVVEPTPAAAAAAAPLDDLDDVLSSQEESEGEAAPKAQLVTNL